MVFRTFETQFKPMPFIGELFLKKSQMRKYYAAKREYLFRQGKILKGMGWRKKIHKLMIALLRLNRVLIERQQIVVLDRNSHTEKPLPKGKRIFGEVQEPVIFTVTHVGSWDYPVMSEVLKVHQYPFAGDPETMYRSFEGLLFWLNGVVVCDTEMKSDRKVAKATAVEVLKSGMNMRYGQPLNIAEMEREEGLNTLRDCMASMIYELMEKYSPFTLRKDLPCDIRLRFMEERKKEYLRVKWTRDVWEEELTVYQSKEHPTPVKVRESFANVKINRRNANVLMPIMDRYEEDQRYNFLEYMKEEWDMKENRKENKKNTVVRENRVSAFIKEWLPICINLISAICLMVTVYFAAYPQMKPSNSNLLELANAKDLEAQLSLADFYYEIGDFSESIYWYKILMCRK